MQDLADEQAGALDAPERWLSASALLDLEDSRLRLRSHALTQLCTSERDKALAIYNFVKRILYGRPFKLRLRTARQVFDASQADAPDKATLLVALMRSAGIPARLRYIELRGEILRGLTSTMSNISRPLAEIWLGDRWVSVDTYIVDAAYMAAARQRLKDRDWEWGYGIHRNGQSVWNGMDDAFLGGKSTAEDPMVVRDLGVFHDPQHFVESAIYSQMHPRFSRAVHLNILVPTVGLAIRDLRAERPPSTDRGTGKLS
ncbi:transglutaminase family protein [uncultured Ramlibacter sp.]|uniref:transglutaminase-like domain-containing protein n=1 Tax=uncultured Ramlibacter sp. TaxID=260755 RepID=UPI0026194313|nr:transglutaminase-like domain-containing protein [uncultured Ramlibacter sp.]